MSQTLTIFDHLWPAGKPPRGGAGSTVWSNSWKPGRRMKKNGQFHTLAERVEARKAHYSNIAKNATPPTGNYRLWRTPWFHSCWLNCAEKPDAGSGRCTQSTGANPVQEASRGNLRAMAEAWVQWGVGKRVQGMWTSSST